MGKGKKVFMVTFIKSGVNSSENKVIKLIC